jgi:hypothetical protein
VKVSSLPSPIWRAVKQEFDAAMCQLWRARLPVTLDHTSHTRHTKLEQSLPPLFPKNRTSQLRPATLVKVTGIGLGISLFLWDWRVGVALTVAGWGLTRLARLSARQRLRLWQELQRIYATQPLLVLVPAAVLLASLADGSELSLWLGLGAALGFGMGQAKRVGASPSQSVLPSEDWQVWVKALGATESLERLAAIQQLQEWIARPQFTPQQGRFWVRALQLRLQQESEPLVQQAILEALEVLASLPRVSSTPVCQLPAALEEPLKLEMPPKRRPPAYQSQLSNPLSEAAQLQNP